MPLSNPYGAHSNAPTGPAKNAILAQRDGRLLKVLWLDHEFLQAYIANNPHSLNVYRHYFQDNSLDDVAGRVQTVLDALKGYEGLVHAVETPWNEAYEGINAGIGDYQRATIEAVNRFKDANPDLLVVGGNWSVGTPYSDVTQGQFQDWEAWAPALAHIDFHGFHEYGPKSVLQDATKNDRGQMVGPYVFRFQYVYNWLEEQGLPTPKVILSEFGIDAGGAGQGFRSLGIEAYDYFQQLDEAGAALAASPHILGAAIFCVGATDPSWHDTFDVAEEGDLVGLLNTEYKRFNPPAPPPAYPPPQHMQAALLGHYRANTEFSEWVATPGNDHDPRDRSAYYDAFIAKREASAGVPAGTFGVKDALAGGYPAFLLPSFEKSAPDFARQSARRLGVPLYRIMAVDAVESAGKAFGVPGRAIIRFEAHLWLARVPANRREWANRYFRVRDGVEEIDDTGRGGWVSLQGKDQAGRALDLTLAATIDNDTAYDCTSMGRFQILGEHHATLGYADSLEMLLSFSGNEANQWKGFEAFVRSDTRLYRALVDGDAATFAHLYNGNVDVYEPLLVAHNWNGDR